VVKAMVVATVDLKIDNQVEDVEMVSVEVEGHWDLVDGGLEAVDLHKGLATDPLEISDLWASG
jgi:hypothetical protein